MRTRPLLMGLAALVFLVCMGVASVFLAGRPARPSLAASAYGTPVVVTTIPNVGNGPWDIAVDPTTNYVYVSNNGGGVTVINGATNATETVVPLDGNDQVGIAVNPEADRIYVGRGTSAHDDVVVINSSSTPMATVTAVPVGHAALSLAVNLETDRIYAAVSANDKVAVIDGATNQVTATATVTPGSYPLGVAVDRITNLVYVANQNTSNVSLIDGATNTVLGTPIPLGGPLGGTSPKDVDVNPNTHRVYVANYGTNDVSVIGGTPQAEVTRVSVCNRPYGVAVNPVTNRVYVCCHGGDSVWVIDGTTNGVLGSPIPVGSSPMKLAVDPNTNRIYTANSGNNTVSVIQDFPIPGVGGIAELPALEAEAAAVQGGSSGPDRLALGALAAAGALVVVTGALYARRRWLR